MYPLTLRAVRASAAVALVAYCGLLATGCASHPKEGTDWRDRPAWVDVLPSESGFIYGVGHGIGSYYSDENYKNAVKDGCADLGLRLKVRVKSSTAMRTTNTSTRLDSYTMVGSDNVVREVHVIDSWTLLDRRGRPERVCVLVKTPVQ